MMLAALLDISTVRISVSIPEKEISTIAPDAETTIEVAALGGETFRGGRIVKNVKSDALTHSYGLLIHLPNPQRRLLPGMVCTVRFASSSSLPRITVPITAVQRGAGQALYVWTVADGTARQTSVTTADTHGGRIVIADGLREGDTVITSGWQKLSEGTRVETKK